MSDKPARASHKRPRINLRLDIDLSWFPRVRPIAPEDLASHFRESRRSPLARLLKLLRRKFTNFHSDKEPDSDIINHLSLLQTIVNC